MTFFISLNPILSIVIYIALGAYLDFLKFDLIKIYRKFLLSVSEKNPLLYFFKYLIKKIFRIFFFFFRLSFSPERGFKSSVFRDIHFRKWFINRERYHKQRVVNKIKKVK